MGYGFEVRDQALIRTVFFWVSVAVIPLLLEVRKACSMSDSSIDWTFHSTKWWTEPSLQVRPSRTLLLPCWCTASLAAILQHWSIKQWLGDSIDTGDRG